MPFSLFGSLSSKILYHLLKCLALTYLILIPDLVPVFNSYKRDQIKSLCKISAT